MALKGILILYPGESSVERIHKPANYSLSRLLINAQDLNCPIYFLNYGRKKEEFKNVKFVPFTLLNFIRLLYILGFSKSVLVISQTIKYDHLAIWLKRLLGYRVLIRRGGVYFGAKYIQSGRFKREAKKERYLKEADVFFSTADGTPVRLYANALGIKKNRVISWVNGFPKIPNTQNYQRLNKIVCISRLSPEKSIHYVIHSFAKALPNLKEQHALHIVGDGPQKENLVSLCKELGVSDFVVFEGMSRDIEKHLYTSKLLITGLSNNTIIEGIATGTPLICIELGEIESLYSTYPNVFVIPYSIGGYGMIPEEELDSLVEETSKITLQILNNYDDINFTNHLNYSACGWDQRIENEKELYRRIVEIDTEI